MLFASSLNTAHVVSLHAAQEIYFSYLPVFPSEEVRIKPPYDIVFDGAKIENSHPYGTYEALMVNSLVPTLHRV